MRVVDADMVNMPILRLQVELTLAVVSTTACIASKHRIV